MFDRASVTATRMTDSASSGTFSRMKANSVRWPFAKRLANSASVAMNTPVVRHSVRMSAGLMRVTAKGLLRLRANSRKNRIASRTFVRCP